MPAITKVRTPKLRAEDRDKLIDEPGRLLVHCRTVAASVRYGAGTAWCISAPGNTHFSSASYEKEATYILIIYRNDGSKEVFTKFCIRAPKRSTRGERKFKIWMPGDTAATNRYDLAIIEPYVTPEVLGIIQDHMNQLFPVRVPKVHEPIDAIPGQLYTLSTSLKRYVAIKMRRGRLWGDQTGIAIGCRFRLTDITQVRYVGQKARSALLEVVATKKEAITVLADAMRLLGKTPVITVAIDRKTQLTPIL